MGMVVVFGFPIGVKIFTHVWNILLNMRRVYHVFIKGKNCRKVNG